MKKTGKKDFMSGLDRLIQSSAVNEKPEQETEVTEIETTPTPEPEKRKKEPAAEKERQITITIPPSLKKTIKKYCANNDITIKELFIRSVSRYMKGGE